MDEALKKSGDYPNIALTPGTRRHAATGEAVEIPASARVDDGTCKNVSYRVDESRFHCSECGFGCWVKNVATGRDELPTHCPNCGRKVVDE